MSEHRNIEIHPAEDVGEPNSEYLHLWGGTTDVWVQNYYSPDYGKNDFKDNGDDTITDRATGLAWMKTDSGHLKAGPKADGGLNWEQALEWAENLEFAGHDDWRLPTRLELHSMVTHDHCRPAVDGEAFPDTPGGFRSPFWSSTSHFQGAEGLMQFAIGFHPSILRPMKDILFDEKIAGSFHFTPGQAYEGVADNGNRSSVHWDLVCIQRPDYGGGEIRFDGKLIRKNGKFLPKSLAKLNP